LAEWYTIEDESRFRFGERHELLNKVEMGSVFWTDGLATETSNNAVVAGRVNPAWKIGQTLIYETEAPFSVD